jgi:putative RNA 2'-phosphotransferase
MQDRREKSKFLSLVLRHEPELVGITLDEAGWVSVDELLAGCRRKGHPITMEELREIVRTSDKQRYALSGDGARIRANQGHSVKVDLGHEPAVPPEVLYHGTAGGAAQGAAARRPPVGAGGDGRGRRLAAR